MENLRSGTLEDILKRLEVRDLVRCRSVCKYWSSLISNPLFVKSHLKHSYLSDLNNAEVAHRRIAICTYPEYVMYHKSNRLFVFNDRHLVGSCNGLVCVSSRFNEVVVINPSTREVNEVSNPQIPKTESLCWGFGYDSKNDDYKIVLGFQKGEKRTCFQMCSLRSKVWKVIGEVSHVFTTTPGILCKGMLHWVPYDIFSKQKGVILSFNLTDEKFCEIPQPDIKYPLRFGQVRAPFCVGIMEDFLCMFYDFRPSSLPSKIWVLKDYNNTKSWEFVEHACENKYDLVHCVKLLMNDIQDKRPSSYETLHCHNRAFLCGPLFVESLVSPHSQENDARDEES